MHLAVPEKCAAISPAREVNLGPKQAISQHTSLGLRGIELVREPRHAPVTRGLGCLTSTVLRYLANRVPNPAENPDIAAHYFEGRAGAGRHRRVRVSVGGIRSAGVNIGEYGWMSAGAVVCAAFCGIEARIQGRNLRYRSTVDEAPGVPGARGEGGALGVRRGEAELSWFEVAWARPGRGTRGSEAGCREVGVDKRK